MKRLSIITILLGMILWTPLTCKVMAQTMSDYTSTPPFISTSIQPNVLLVLDNSGSMNDEAYATTYDPTQFSSGQYYGLFDATKYYQYTNNGRWEIFPVTDTDGDGIQTDETLPSASATIANPIASGNLLNWATMSRISVAKKLLIGGKASPRSPAGAVTVKLFGETTWGFLKTFDNTSSANLIAPFTGNYRYNVSSTANFSMVPVVAGTDTVYTSPNANVSIPAGWTVFPAATNAWEDVDDTISPTISNDADTTYIQAQGTASPAMFGYDYAGAKTGTITNVGVRVVAKSNCSSTLLRRTRGVLRIGGVDYDSGFTAIATSYPATAYSFNWATNPATGAAWQWSDIKDIGNPSGNLEGFGIRPNQSNAGCYHRATQVYLVVTSGTPSGGPYNIIIDQGMTPASGIIDNLSSDARFGLAYYANSSNGGRVQEYVGFGSAVNMITSISGLAPSTWTPLGETLYEMIRHFRQDAPFYANAPADYATGNVFNDPYYYRYSTLAGSGLTDQYVPCAKSFILLLTDGESTQDITMDASIKGPPGFSWGKGVNTDGSSTSSAAGQPRLGGTNNGQTYTSSGTDYLVDAAYWARSTDARPGACTTTPTSWQQCIPGTQNVVIYPVFMFGSGSTLLKDAAIYGGFEDMNGDGKPGPDLREYLRDSNGDGSVTAADDPITYFEGDDGFALEASITNAIASIMKRSASGTSVSILATSQEGEGALYQAYYYPEKIMDDGTKRSWLGYCRGMFLDSFGNLREDSDADSTLIFKNDKIIRMRLDTSTNEVKADLYNDVSPEDGDADPATLNADGSKIDTVNNTVAIDAVATLWEAGEKLAKDITTRNIYTWVDLDNDGVVDNGDFGVSPLPSGEAYPFVSSSATALRQYIRAADDPESTNIINFVAGNNVTGYRNRCIPVTGATTETGCSGATDRVWALGDIVYSTPTTVAGPREGYDQIYGIASYTNFRNLYRDRRNIVYVGANDGMLHAFNAGVYTAGDNAVTTDVEHGKFVPNATTDWPGVVMGSELWAFIPYDNLPHLKWLTDPNYTHIYYTDLKPKVTDVRIFCDSDASLTPPTTPNCIDGQTGVSHPGGWGTILIAGMRFGGGAITADISGTTRTFRSAYYVFDITNPEKKPKLLWRFTDANLGFTTSYPGIIHINSSPEKWFMVVGSGPDNNVPAGTRGYDGTSTQQGRIFVVNLLNGTAAITFTNLGINNAGAVLDANTFMGDPTVIDGDLDYTTDVIYIGSATSTNSGKVFRINTNQDANPANWALSTLINQGKPVLVGPSVSKDSLNNFWVFFGTGRFLASADKTNSDPQTFYGIKDACWKTNTTTSPCPASANPYLQTALLNSSNLAVCTSAGGGGIYDTSSGTCATGTQAYSSYTNLLATVRAGSGWYINLVDPTTPSERVIARSVVLGGVVIFTAFTPSSDICAMLGDSNLYALYYETGTAYNKPVIGYSGTTVLRSKSLGKGMPTTVGIAVGSKTKGYIQTSTGTIVEVETEPALDVRSGPAGWREKEGGGGTVDIEEIYKHIVK
ncbi:MAG: PilC/PilY family type IV pilus protein [Deltaproteobacteria bacterium]|nr:PilC/PilY family type IV pilus protein [Deltaproteobacteria bacterium]